MGNCRRNRSSEGMRASRIHLSYFSKIVTKFIFDNSFASNCYPSKPSLTREGFIFIIADNRSNPNRINPQALSKPVQNLLYSEPCRASPHYFP